MEWSAARRALPREALHRAQCHDAFQRHIDPRPDDDGTPSVSLASSRVSAPCVLFTSWPEPERGREVQRDNNFRSDCRLVTPHILVELFPLGLCKQVLIPPHSLGDRRRTCVFSKNMLSTNTVVQQPSYSAWEDTPLPVVIPPPQPPCCEDIAEEPSRTCGVDFSWRFLCLCVWTSTQLTTVVSKRPARSIQTHKEVKGKER